MISKIIEVIVVALVLIFSIISFMKGYKETKSDFEKILYTLLSVAFTIPLIIYYLDRYNLPSKLGYMDNINASNWVSILTNYSATIISTLISAVFLIFVTFKQMKETYKDNIKLNNENQRLQNLPFLRYKFTHKRIDDELFEQNQKWIFSNQDVNNSDSIDFTMEIENIGLNAVRRVCLELKADIFKEKEYLELCNQRSKEKKEVKKKEFIITNIKKGDYKIEIVVYYQDLLKNWYQQKVHITISVTNIWDSKTNNRNQINSIIVDEEEKLPREPSIVKKIKQ